MAAGDRRQTLGGWAPGLKPLVQCIQDYRHINPQNAGTAEPLQKVLCLVPKLSHLQLQFPCCKECSPYLLLEGIIF
jgi:hypothetical protein